MQATTPACSNVSTVAAFTATVQQATLAQCMLPQLVQLAANQGVECCCSCTFAAVNIVGRFQGVLMIGGQRLGMLALCAV
jgi:tetrahydromethanopterin S-methyltransferase subunit E